MLGLLGAMVFRFFPPTPPGSTTLVPTCAHVHIHVQNAKTHANIILTNPTDFSLPLLFLPLFFLPPLARAHMHSLSFSLSRCLFLALSLSLALSLRAPSLSRAHIPSLCLSLLHAVSLSRPCSLALPLSRAHSLSRARSLSPGKLHVPRRLLSEEARAVIGNNGVYPMTPKQFTPDFVTAIGLFLSLCNALQRTATHCNIMQ